MPIYLQPTPPHSGLTALQGGSTGNYYHLTQPQHNFLSALFSGGTSLSATTFYSAGTDLSLLINSAGLSTFVQPGMNIITGGTASRPVVSTVDSPVFSGTATVGSLSAGTVSTTTYYSGATEIGSLFAPASVVPTYVQPGTNVFTGGTTSRPIVHVLGSPIFTGVTAQSVSGTSVSATTYYSGSTELGSLFASMSIAPTRVLPGAYVYTSGTQSGPIVNVSASTGGFGVLDFGKVAAFGTVGNLKARGLESIPAISSYSSGSNVSHRVFSSSTINGTAIYGNSTNGFAGHFSSTSSTALFVQSDQAGIFVESIGVGLSSYGTSGYGVGAYSDSNTAILAISQNNSGAFIATYETGFTQDIALFYNLNSDGLAVKNDGSLEWTQSSAATTTLRNLLSTLPVNRTLYVSKNGDNSSGDTPWTAFNSLSGAVQYYSANFNDASITNPFSIIVSDTSAYSSPTLNIPNYVSIYAHKSDYYGKIVLNDGSRFSVKNHYPLINGGSSLVTKSAITTTSYYSAEILDTRGSGGTFTTSVGIQSTGSTGQLFVDVKKLYATSVGVGSDGSTSNGHIHLNIEDLYLAGTQAAGIRTQGSSATSIVGYVHHIIESGSYTDTVAFTLAGGRISIVSTEILCDFLAYVVQRSGSKLDLICPYISVSQV